MDRFMYTVLYEDLKEMVRNLHKQQLHKMFEGDCEILKSTGSPYDP